MKDGPAFQMYASDFYVDTNSWTIDEVGIYTRFLLSEWVNGSLPIEEVRLARIAGCSLKKFQKGWLSIKFKFHLNGRGQYINDRLEFEREKQVKYRELQSEKGKISAKLKYNRGSTEPVTEPEATSQPKVNSSSSSSSSSLKKYYKDDKFNYVCKTCGKLYQEWNNFQNHKCKEEGDERTGL